MKTANSFSIILIWYFLISYRKICYTYLFISVNVVVNVLLWVHLHFLVYWLMKGWICGALTSLTKQGTLQTLYASFIFHRRHNHTRSNQQSPLCAFSELYCAIFSDRKRLRDKTACMCTTRCIDISERFLGGLTSTRARRSSTQKREFPRTS